MQAVMISTQPKWCEKIASGKKTIEVRKTKPKIEVPFKCYIYCTRGEDLWLTDNGIEAKTELTGYLINGKVIGEFVCDEITYIGNVATDSWKNLLGGVHEWHKKLVKEHACLTEDECLNYGGKHLWHISDLKIYDKPKELREFYSAKICKDYYGGNSGCEEFCGFAENNECWCGLVKLRTPPQSWCYVEVNEC